MLHGLLAQYLEQRIAAETLNAHAAFLGTEASGESPGSGSFLHLPGTPGTSLIPLAQPAAPGRLAFPAELPAPSVTEALASPAAFRHTSVPREQGGGTMHRSLLHAAPQLARPQRRAGAGAWGGNGASFVAMAGERAGGLQGSSIRHRLGNAARRVPATEGRPRGGGSFAFRSASTVSPLDVRHMHLLEALCEQWRLAADAAQEEACRNRLRVVRERLEAHRF